MTKKVSSITSNDLIHKPSKALKTYGVVIQNLENEELKRKVHFEIELQCISKKNEPVTFEINRKQVYINDAEPDLLVEQLADKAGKVLFPVHIAINKYGQIDQITNHESIVERWQEKKVDLLDYYKGSTAERIMANMETVLLDVNDLKLSLYKNWFFNLYFAPLYEIYKGDLQQVVERDYPTFPASIKYKALHEVEKEVTDTNKIIVQVKGNAIDERTVDEIVAGYDYPKSKTVKHNKPPVHSQFEIQYKLHSNDCSIFSIIADFKTEITSNKDKITKVEIFEQS